MNLQQLNELDINDIASWPKWAKGIFILFCCVLTGGANSTSKCNSRLKIRLLSEVRQKPPVAV